MKEIFYKKPKYKTTSCWKCLGYKKYRGKTCSKCNGTGKQKVKVVGELKL